MTADEPVDLFNKLCWADIVMIVLGYKAQEDIRFCEGESCNYCGKFNEKVIEIREISDEDAEKEILDYYRTYCDASHYPDVIACDLRLDLKQTVRICDKLIKEDKIEVAADSMKAGVREP